MKVEVTTVQRKRGSKEIEQHTFTAYAAQYMTTIQNSREVLQMIELVGPTTAIRAIWADIVKGRDGDFPVKTSTKIKVSGKWHNIYIIPGTKYVQYSEKKILMIYHIDFTQDKRKAIFGGNLEKPPIHFMEALTKNFPHIPFLIKKWEMELWKAMIDAQRVKPLKSYGPMMGWIIEPVARYNEDSAEDAIKELVLSGTISSGS